MHNDKTVVAVKVNGSILREHGDSVTLPFGSEYSILIRNLNSVRLMASVSVDGSDVAESRFVIPCNGSLDLERFIRAGNLAEGNRFKFIERTAEVEKHRGIGSYDGLIRVETWRERVFIEPPRHEYLWLFAPKPPYSPVRYRRPMRPGGPKMASLGRPSHITARGPQARSAAHPPPKVSGITVPGSHSSQVFYSSTGFMLESQSVVVVIRLKGGTPDQPATAPATVDFKATCESCGKVNRATHLFCDRCGTALKIYA